MVLTPILLLGLVAAMTAAGFFIAYEFGKTTRAFTWHEYALLVGTALVAFVPVVVTYGPRVVSFFAVSAILGILLEHVTGFVFHKTLHRHLWRYYRLTLGGYTSLLSAPFWGMAGIFFFLLAKALAV